jgi:hypothetical protein
MEPEKTDFNWWRNYRAYWARRLREYYLSINQCSIIKRAGLGVFFPAAPSAVLEKHWDK